MPLQPIREPLLYSTEQLLDLWNVGAIKGVMGVGYGAKHGGFIPWNWCLGGAVYHGTHPNTTVETRTRGYGVCMGVVYVSMGVVGTNRTCVLPYPPLLLRATAHRVDSRS
jgi:hypothetical protein